MKKLLIVLGALIVVIGGAAYYLFSSLDGIVKAVIEKTGSEVAGVKVSLSDVKIKLSEGKASLLGLSIANPPGFTQPHAIRFGEISVALDTGSVGKNPIVIRSVLVGAPQVTYEINQAGASNIDALSRNLKSAQPKSEGQPAKESKEKGPDIVIDQLDITKGQVTLTSPIPGVSGQVGLGDIRLTKLGRDKNGLSPEQLAKVVLDAVAGGAVRAVSNSGLTKALGGTLDAVSGAGAGAAGAPGKALDSLKGLTGRQ